MGTDIKETPWFEKSNSISSWVPPDKQDKPTNPDAGLDRAWNKFKDQPQPQPKDKDKA